MIPTIFLSLFPVFAGIAAAEPESSRMSMTRLVGRDEMVFRVPVQPRSPSQGIRWVEQQGPRCIPIRAIRRALLSGRRNVDFVLANKNRVRAKVDEDCPALDFYAGLYLMPNDELLCARRDTIHSRMGGSCRIRGFSHLQPTRRR